MKAVEVRNLRKIFKQDRREKGFMNAVKSLFHRDFATIEAVKDISFEINEGEFVGFIGPNGAGKTTTLKMLSGILNPTSGHAAVLGSIPWKREAHFQKQFSLVMGQKNQMWWDLPVLESFEFNRAVYEIPKTVFERQKELLINLLDIGRLLNIPVRKLSLGERMKCELATALLHKPKILFLDEPTIGLDIVSQKNMRGFLREYNQKERATIMLTSHYMEDIRRLCDRVMIIDHGELIYDGNYTDLVERFAKTKTIEMVLAQKIDRGRLERLGTVTDYRDMTCRLAVPRERVAEITTELLKEFPVDDISIHEETMEEIVSGIFTHRYV